MDRTPFSASVDRIRFDLPVQRIAELYDEHPVDGDDIAYMLADAREAQADAAVIDDEPAAFEPITARREAAVS